MNIPIVLLNIVLNCIIKSRKVGVTSKLHFIFAQSTTVGSTSLGSSEVS